MKVSVDQSVCREYANCIVEAPDVFDLEEDSGKVVALVVEPDPAQFDEVHAAAAACPVRAITLHE
ncbi:ferredoxin [Blastococcus sp. PRF04-17]|uniref:ferredoxin n=1 Tax=Blastococcus sp. PRF04-17 TaxID=2933797 RepID=UPI001FF540E8|nr:ferredoxin [Blastococcus sp. PRF04-17]UOY02275.1 ferredoxin [Blastococcus sp. PRF04-17]